MLSLVRAIRPNQAISSLAGQKRTAIVTFPRVRAPFWVKVAEGIFFFTGILAIPAYIAFNIKNYRPAKEE